jgi:pyrimidine operon attenuation protein / uracil phosphoribosyltransferase
VPWKPPPDAVFNVRSVVLDDVAMGRVLRRMAYEVAEKVGPNAYLIGIQTRGVHLAARMASILANEADPKGGPRLGTVDITMYRDDLHMGSPKQEVGPTDLSHSIDGQTVVLVDDVLYTGRTIRAAMDVLLDYGRPKAIHLACMVDRGNRELPIQPDFVGVRVTTGPNESVRVMLSERGETDQVVLREKVG